MMTQWAIWTAAAVLAGVPTMAGAQCAMEDAGRQVTMHVPAGHVPAALDPARPVPLVILLHGSGASGAAMLRDSRLAATADRHGFVIAAPDGGIPVERGHVWNIPGVPTIAGTIPTEDDADDVAFIGRLIDRLAEQGCVDRTRVYVTGLSGGGRMSSWLGCVLSDRIAAIAPVVGLRAGRPNSDDPTRPDPVTCTPERPVPVMAFAGDADRTNPVSGGGAPYWSYSMHAAEQRWAALNGCAAAPVTGWVAPTVYEEAYRGCRGEADVIGRITVGGGHSWVADNEAMWEFFARHARWR